MGSEPKFVITPDPVLDFRNQGHMDEGFSFRENPRSDFKVAL